MPDFVSTQSTPETGILYVTSHTACSSRIIAPGEERDKLIDAPTGSTMVDDDVTCSRKSEARSSLRRRVGMVETYPPSCVSTERRGTRTGGGGARLP